jgi:hypothetical protein
MTDTDGLRQMLDELADQTPEVPAQEWLAGTRHKVRVRRRARWAGAGGAMALALAAAVVAPQVVDRSDSEPKPVQPQPDGRDGWPFPDGMDTERVIAARVNDPGASGFEWTTKTMWPSDTVVMQFCRLPRISMPRQPGIRTVITVNGHRLAAEPCAYLENYPPVDGDLVTQDISPNFGDAYGVEPNEPIEVAMTLEQNGDRVEMPGAAFGFALVRCGLSPEGNGGVGGRPGCDALSFPGSNVGGFVSGNRGGIFPGTGPGD